jgi:NitT/TauT family transport system ATP-binding protein
VVTVEKSIVEISGVGKRYASSRGDVDALMATDLQVDEGKFVSLVGPSGCGKTTLLKMIAGLVVPTTGTIHVHGNQVVKPGPHVGMMFQQSVLLPWRDVLGNILLPIEIIGGKRDQYRARAFELLDLVGLNGFAHHRPTELSGGMQQRVAICRALITDPSVLLLDEPFGALDSITREQLNDLLLTVCSSTNKTTVLVTHDIDEAVYLSDQVAVISARPGRIIRTLDIGIPRPRAYAHRTTPQFERYATDVRQMLGMVSSAN